MAALKDWKTLSAPFGNDGGQIVVVTYDFSQDTGALADLDVFTASGEVLVELLNVDVESAVTSGGSAVFDLGKGAGGTEFWSDKAYAGFTANAQLQGDTAGKVIRLADTNKIVLGIEGATVTAGKFHMMFKVYRRK